MSYNIDVKINWYGQQVHICTILEVRENARQAHLRWHLLLIERKIIIFLHNVKIFVSMSCTYFICSLFAHVDGFSPSVRIYNIKNKLNFEIQINLSFWVIKISLRSEISIRNKIHKINIILCLDFFESVCGRNPVFNKPI